MHRYRSKLLQMKDAKYPLASSTLGNSTTIQIETLHLSMFRKLVVGWSATQSYFLQVLGLSSTRNNKTCNFFNP